MLRPAAQRLLRLSAEPPPDRAPAHGGFSAEHEDRHPDLVLLGVDLLHGTGEAGKGAVRDLHGVAHVVQHHDLVLFHAQGRHLVLRQGDGLVGLAHEAGDASDVADQMPGVICQDHLDQDVAGKYLALHFLHDAGLGDLGDGFHRNLHLEDHIGHAAVDHGFLDGRLHGVLVAGVGVDHIPFAFSAMPHFLSR